MGTEYRLRDSNEGLQRKITLNANNEVEIQDSNGTPVVSLEKYVIVPVLIPDSNQSGLAADSTGVKWTSNFNFKVGANRLVKATIRATWTASAGDSVAAIELYDVTAGTAVGSVSGNSGTDASEDITGLVEDHLYTVRLNITTASGTSGATTSLTYVTVELVYR